MPPSPQSIAPQLKRLFTRLLTVKSKEPKVTIGVDVGAASVKAVALGSRKGAGPWPILAQQLVALDPAKEGDDAAQALKAAVEALHVPVRGLAVHAPRGLPGRRRAERQHDRQRRRDQRAAGVGSPSG